MRKKFLLFILLAQFNYAISTDREAIFTQIFLHHGFGQSESVSGPGSNLIQTQAIRAELPRLLKEYKIETILDAPCGDFFWMRFVDLQNYKYIGADIVKKIIENNIKQFSAPNRKFMHVDLATGSLPKVDLIICRDLLVHLLFKDIFNVLRNFKKSGSTYLLTTTFTWSHRKNLDITTGPFGWRVLNLELPPFKFPKPILVMSEKCTEHQGIFADKCLALWKLDQLNL